MKVIITDIDGISTKLAIGYYVNVEEKTVTYPYPSGTVLAPGKKITLLREVPVTQETDLVNQGPFHPEVIEAALDKLTAIAQQHDEKLERSLKLSATATSNVSVDLPAPYASSVIGWDDTGTRLVNMSSPLGTTARAIDGGNAISVYLPAQIYDGGDANG